MVQRFSPFRRSLHELTGDDLSVLYDVAEGWYVEYKSQRITVNRLAKSLSAFANQYGGWLVLGAQENSDTHTVEFFPGVNVADVEAFFIDLRNAAKDRINPEVYFRAHVIHGPWPSIDLQQNRSVVVVFVPPGPETPYLHNDGRVYRRIADASDPQSESDQTILERLWRRGRDRQQALEHFVKRLPITSEAESEQCRIHILLFSDPYEIQGHHFRGGIKEFREIMRDDPFPFDNFFTYNRGFVARQLTGNDPYERGLTWEFDCKCHSFMTLPINHFAPPRDRNLLLYDRGGSFAQQLDTIELENGRILDLNMVFDGFNAIIQRHRALTAESEIQGPFYGKAHIENAWRTIPFLDADVYIDHMREFGVPVVQADSALAPSGTKLESFVILPERDYKSLTTEECLSDAVRFSARVLPALGVPRELFVSLGEELTHLSKRFKKHQDRRNKA